MQSIYRMVVLLAMTVVFIGILFSRALVPAQGVALFAGPRSASDETEIRGRFEATSGTLNLTALNELGLMDHVELHQAPINNSTDLMSAAPLSLRPLVDSGSQSPANESTQGTPARANAYRQPY